MDGVVGAGLCLWVSPLKAYFATLSAGRGDKRTGMDRNKAQTKVYIYIFLGTSTANSNMPADMTSAEAQGISGPALPLKTRMAVSASSEALRKTFESSIFPWVNRTSFNLRKRSDLSQQISELSPVVPDPFEQSRVCVSRESQ